MPVFGELRALRRNPHILVASLTSNLLSLALPIVMIQVYDRIIPNSGTATLIALAIGLGVALLADAALRFSRSVLLATFGARFEVSTHAATVRRLLDGRSTISVSDAPGVLYNKLRHIERLRSYYTGDASAALLDLPFIIMFLGLMALISLPIALVILSLVTAMFIIVRLMRREVLTLNFARQQADERRQSFLIETLSGIDTVKGLAIEANLERRYERLLSSSASINAQLAERNQLIQGIIGAIGLLGPVVSASVGSILVIQESITMGELAATVLLTGRIIQPVLRLEALLVGEEDTKRHEAELTSLFDRSLIECGTECLPRIDKLELRHLTWQPDPRAPPRLSDLNFTFRRGDCVLLRGPEGAGRSSLLRLIAGQIAAQDGGVLFNGQPAEVFDFGERQRQVRMLTSNDHLLEGTLLDNLTGFSGVAHLDEALDLTSRFGIDRFIARIPEGLGLRVSASKASVLPKSISDAILMIAGLVGQPQVILFDEANTSLDFDTDHRLLELLRERMPDLILIMVSHRPSYQMLANREIHFNRGKLTETIHPLVLRQEQMVLAG